MRNKNEEELCVWRGAFRGVMRWSVFIFFIFHFRDEIWAVIGAIFSLSFLKGW